MSRNVHLVGSVPLPDAREVFTAVSRALGPYLKRVPDGETGERLDWIIWLEPIFANHPAFEPSDETFQLHGGVQGRRRYRLKPGAAVESVKFDNLFYGDIAIRSYGVFAELKRQGIISAQCKFQIDLVPAHSVIWLFVQEDLQRAIDTLFNDAMLREIDKIAAALPHEQIAIQFDIASAVFARLQRAQRSPYGATKEEMQETFAQIVLRLANHVPADIDLMFHFCYGDAGHKHVVEPTDMSDMVEFANRLSRQVTRSIQLIHMPVPRDRTDDAYFAPLDRLSSSRKRSCAWAWSTTPTAWTARCDGSRRPRSTARRSRLRPNAASAAAIRPRCLSCCAFMPRSRRSLEVSPDTPCQTHATQTASSPRW